MLYIFSPQEQLLAILKPEGPDTSSQGGHQLTPHATSYIGYESEGDPGRVGACPYFDAIHTEQLNGFNVFNFSVPGDHPDAAYVLEDNLVAFRDLDGELILFEIKRIHQEHGTTNVKTAYCELAALELLDDHIEDVRPTNCGAEFALMQALAGTRWQPGTVASFGSKSVRYFRTNPLAAIKKILETWGGEVRYRITMTATGQITGRYVDILARRGASTGKRFEYTKDIHVIERTVDISGIKTALYGYGRGEETGDGFGRRITFAEIEWSTAAGDPVDKPLGQAWVGDPEALALWGRANRHRFGQYEDPDIEDPGQLLQQTWAELQRRKEPLVNYQLTVADLEHIAGLDHEAVRLGDTVAVIDRAISPPIEVSARIIELKRYLNEPYRSKVILGNFLPSITDDAAKVRALQATVHDRSGIWNEKITEGRSYKSVYIDGDSGLRVLDEQNRERVSLGEYAAGKYGLKLTSKDGTRTILDEDGVVDAYQINDADNLAPGKPLVLRVYVPPGVSRVDQMELAVFADRFRAYQTGAAEAGAESYYVESDTIQQVLAPNTGVYTPYVKIPEANHPYQWHANEVIVTVENTSGLTASLSVGLFVADYGSTGGMGVAAWGLNFGGGEPPETFQPSQMRKFRAYKGESQPTSQLGTANEEYRGKGVMLYIANRGSNTVSVRGWVGFDVQTKHVHSPVYDIYEGPLPTTIQISIDGIDRTAALGGPWGDPNNPIALPPLQIAPYIQTPGWHTIAFSSATLGRLVVALTCKQFITT